MRLKRFWSSANFCEDHPALRDESLRAGGLEGNDPCGELAVECNRAPAEADECVDIAEVAASELGAIEYDLVGWRQFGCCGGLFGGIGIFRQKNVGELVYG